MAVYGYNSSLPYLTGIVGGGLVLWLMRGRSIRARARVTTGVVEAHARVHLSLNAGLGLEEGVGLGSSNGMTSTGLLREKES